MNNTNEAVENAVATVAGLHIPAALRKGAFSAINRLLGAAVDVPAAYLESFSEDIRATTEARKLVRIRAAEALSKGFATDEKFADRAFRREASKIMREQETLEDVAKIAIEDISRSNPDKEPEREIDQDWLNTFQAEAVQKSSEDMKLVFGRILSGEIKKPGSFSIAAVRTLGMMDQTSATLFRHFCSLVISVAGDSRVASIKGNAAKNGLSTWGLPYAILNQLREFGLINSDFNSYMPYGQFATKIQIPIEYMGRLHKLIALDGANQDYRVNGVELTKIGRELRAIVELVEIPTYTAALYESFTQNKYELRPIAATV
ncbi:MAG: DUF2806 domain-containing protein [Amphiplicatus sp.]